jgi:dethiobiotin synthetase
LKAPDRGIPTGLRADGSIIHPVFTEEAVRARYLKALGHVVNRTGFTDDLREQLVFKMTPSELGRKTPACFTAIEQRLL